MVLAPEFNAESTGEVDNLAVGNRQRVPILTVVEQRIAPARRPREPAGVLLEDRLSAAVRGVDERYIGGVGFVGVAYQNTVSSIISAQRPAAVA